MRRDRFLAKHSPSWRRLEDLVRLFDAGKRRVSALDLGERAPDPAEFDVLYRLVCRHLALSRHRQYGDDLTSRLNDLALRAYRHLYGTRPGLVSMLRGLLLDTIPSTIRTRWRSVAVAAAAFALPLAAMAFGVLAEPSLARTVFTGQQVREIEKMYDPASEHFARERAADGNLQMFGYYVANNVGIAFKTFAWGVAAGVGSAFMLVINGLFIGAVMGHLAGIGYGRTFFPFVAGHSAFELSAIVLAGAAGLELGWAVLSPGRLLRVESLRRAGQRGVAMIGGSFVLLVAAAFVEAYWSPLVGVSPSWKYGMAAALWALVVVWIARAPRHAA